MARPAPTYNRIRPLLYPGSKLMIVGEAPGERESLQGIPFVGASGELQDEMLKDVSIYRRDVSFTNVFLTRPLGNKIEAFTCPKADLPIGYDYPMLSQGKYVKPEYLYELDRLKDEIEEVQPNLVLAVGAVALWALTGLGQIGKYRGNTMESTLVPGQKILPTYHPASLFRMWSNKIIVMSDLVKAKRELEFPEIRRPPRKILINPDFNETKRFFWEHIMPSKGFSFDLETCGGNYISCISFAPNAQIGITVPFIHFKPDGSVGRPYWSTSQEELRVWTFLRVFLESKRFWKMAQNGMFDIQMLGLLGIAVRNYAYDTMIAQASLMPELQKGLGFLGSVYTNESSWKVLKPKRKMARTDNKAND